MKLDTVDYKIISLLKDDARASPETIAQVVGVTARTVRNRIHKLIEHQVIAPEIIINPRAFGYQLTVDIFCKVDQRRASAVIAALMAIPEVVYIATAAGEADISIQAIFQTSDDFYHFIAQQLPAITGLERVSTVIVPKIHQEPHEWRPAEIAAFNEGREAAQDPTDRPLPPKNA